MRGPGTNEKQIEVLREKVGEAGIAAAQSIIDSHGPEVIALAHKLMRASIVKEKLPKSVTKLLDGLSKEDAEIVRDKLVKVKG